MCVYSCFIKPILFRLDPEQAHALAHNFIRNVLPVFSIFGNEFIYKKNDLQINIFGKILNSPVGLAAGFDKNGDLVESLRCLGFGFAEIGSITGQAHEGNPKPRLWRLPADKALINWLGLNNEGAICISQKLAKGKFSIPVGVNIAKTNKPNISGEPTCEDMISSFRCIKYLPLLYVALNVSCPNTHEGVVEEVSVLARVIEQINKENTAHLPIVLKLSPDSSDRLIKEMVELGKSFSIAGFICGNTSTSREGLKSQNAAAIKNGGLSGVPLRPLSLALCRKVYELKADDQIIIGCGGISTGQDAYAFVRAGASLLQVYTAFVYEGPSVVRKINEELSALLTRDKLSLVQAIGADTTLS